jgi:methylenetetrahydrofolate dehydrogenase (NADP+)/methenyltetrahydrofolate cyclohydrolase
MLKNELEKTDFVCCSIPNKEGVLIRNEDMQKKIIDGKAISTAIKDELKLKIKTMAQQNIIPGLAVILVGDNPASQIYVNSKTKTAKNLDIFATTIKLEKDIKEDYLIGLIDELNDDRRYHGILVQLPLPYGISEKNVVRAISPRKDVDGLHPENMGRLVLGDPYLVPCTPLGIQELLIRSNVEIEGSSIVIVGRSNIVGKPLLNLLIQKAKNGNATVTLCHTGTRNLMDFTRECQILVVAAGMPEFITGEFINEGCVIIDVGQNRIDDTSQEKGYRLTGDVHFESCAAKARLITPVPGGVGPMTITMLMSNTVRAAETWWSGKKDE